MSAVVPPRAAALRVGIVGCGAIVQQYLATFDRLVDVELVLNLTVPAAHAEVALAALAAGKHVYGEKPLAARWPSRTRTTSPATSTPGPGAP